jgi:glycosyltransferase involved in cell wall biosynthesis
MHLAVDAVGNVGGGGLVVLRDTLKALLRENSVDRITVFSSPGIGILDDVAHRVEIVEVEGAATSYVQRVAWYLDTCARKAREIGADILLCMNGMGWGISGVPAVHFVQQSLPFSPEALSRFSWSDRIKYSLVRKLTLFSIRRSACTVVQTPWMKSLVHARIGPHHRVEIVFPAGVGEKEVGSASPPGPPKLLYVGSMSPHKNIEVMLEGFGLLRKRIPSAEMILTIEARPGLTAPGLSFVGQLSREDLFRTYSEATLLVMPSLVETVGLPLVEAMSMGLPVLAADRPYARDVCGSAAEYFDPHSATSMAAEALAILDDPIRLSSLRNNVRVRLPALNALPSYDYLGSILLAALGKYAAA